MKNLYIILGFIFVLSACGGSGSSGSQDDSVGDNHNDNSDQTVPNAEYKLGGRVVGLKGAVTLVNVINTGSGDDIVYEEITLTNNGYFDFQKKLGNSARFTVNVISATSGQLCRPQNYTGFIVRDRSNLIIECAAITDMNVTIDKPDSYELAELSLRSNYQALGSLGQSPLTGTFSKILAFNNSLLTLLDSEGNIVYLAFVDDVSLDSVTVSSESTALVLVLMHPLVTTAMQDRGLLVRDVLADLIAAINLDGDLDALAAQIEQLAESKKSLINEGNDLTSLSKVLSLAVSFLASLGDKDVADSNSDAQKVSQVVPQAPQSIAGPSGIAFDYMLATDETEGITITAENQRHRYAVLSSVGFDSVILGPTEQTSFVLDGGLSSQETMSVSIVGPGSLGELGDFQDEDFYRASAYGGLYLYLMPNIQSLLGLSAPADFFLEQCIDPDTRDGLIQALVDSPAVKDGLSEGNYFSAYTEMVSVGVDYFLTASGSFGTALDQLFDCDAFVVGVLIDDQQVLAKENVSQALSFFTNIYSSTVIDNLFRAPPVSELVAAISDSQVSSTWVLGNVLQLDIFAGSPSVIEGETIEFSANCYVPSTNQPINDCVVEWSFEGAETAKGNSVQHSYALPGNYTVSATAMDADGATQTQTLDIQVFEDRLMLEVSASTTTLREDETLELDAVCLNPATREEVSDCVVDWLLGDGSTLQGRSVQYAYSEAGTYTVSATATAANGGSASEIETLTVIVEENNGQFSANGENFVVQQIKTLPNPDEAWLQIQLFTRHSEQPALRLQASGIDFGTEGRGNGRYVLDECDEGFYVSQSEVRYCTKAENDINPEDAVSPPAYFGVMTISTDDSDANKKRAIFEFEAVEDTCFSDCKPITISGEIFFSNPI